MLIPDLYAILGVDKTVGAEELKKAYRRVAKEFHPDTNPLPEATDKFKEAKEAYNILSDETSRKEYDEDVARGELRDSHTVTFKTAFDTFYSNKKSAASPIDGDDTWRRVPFYVHEIYHEASLEKTISYRRKAICPDCKGDGRMATHHNPCTLCGGVGSYPKKMVTALGTITSYQTCTACKGFGKADPIPCSRCETLGWIPEDAEVSFTIPRYAGDPLQLKMEGLGDAGREGGKTGDLTLLFTHDKADRFHIIREFDLEAKHTIPLRTAIAGGDSTFVLPDGEEITIPVPSGAVHGHRIAVLDKGLYNPRAGRRCICYVELQVEMPVHLTPKDAKAIATILQKYE